MVASRPLTQISSHMTRMPALLSRPLLAPMVQRSQPHPEPQSMSETILFAESALLPDGWARDVAIGIASDGHIASVKRGAEAKGAHVAAGPLLPGMPNLHRSE